MQNIKEYLSGKKYISLDSVKYDYTYKESISNPQLICKDDYNVQLKENKIIITVTRHVEFEPDYFLVSDISYSVTHELLNEKKEDFLNANFNLREEIEKDRDYFIPDEMDRVSLIISQLTDSFEGRPIITAPYLML